MSVPVWCADLAADFWAKAGSPPPFPRDLKPVIPSAVPVSVIELPGVSVAKVRAWFDRQDIAVPVEEPDRPLRACLVAWLGEGFAFIDATDEPDEQAFSVAHELAHFLRDYLHPRETVTRRLGAAAIEVLDGRRPPTPEERFQAVLRHAPIGPFAHLMRRDETGRPLSAAEREAEFAADRLAFELLAPASALGELGDRDALERRLVREFGLPAEPAARYAALLVPEKRTAGSHVSRFFVT
ncbi:Uncharacterized protein OS=Roseiflexus sp. (strain RS-1) GN=RoseRS_2254 PE=4 SV=1: DUF955 [Gemmataceae bacterium]|nr:Uncharacterized protein OS=Roseiflexus sp. (strain RS-1) GN=RoseRS_2254 PE=4 SV=1: DUF955 [Gemmataceae bacterium]VTT97837.1 Uncharacterized protein OS=Roseiflexus sp. (strain RS-1) GN=RoseRS_2254 PE=4 SV=1: DUF955 [Gemmataceae bacterium]